MKLAISTLVFAHLVAILWHGDAHSTLGIDLSAAKTLYVLIVILAAPIISAILIWTRFTVFGFGLFAISMAGALVFGVYHHYVLVSPDNIAHLPTGLAEAHLQFIESAAVIAMFELFSAFLGFLLLGHAYASHTRHA
jgi:hypothetical protein